MNENKKTNQQKNEGLPVPPLLEVHGLSVQFKQKTVVNQVSFTLSAGEKLALVGESGSGKTITALSLLQLTGATQTSGQAVFQGRNLLTLPDRDIRTVRGEQIAMVFQEPMTALNPLMGIGQQIVEVLELKQALTRAQAWNAAVEMLARTGIPEPERRAQSYPHQLSGGQRQRAMIAMALASKPLLLLADEPTTALDVTLRGQILDLLSDLQRETGMAVLLITHDLHLVRRFADRVAVMERGVLVEQGTVASVFAQPEHPYTQRLLSSQPRRDVVELDPDKATPSPLLQMQNLQVIYPVPLAGWRGWFKKGEFVAVQGISQQLLPGQTLGVVGESGSGKSTLAQAILGLLPHTGDLQLAGQRWQQPPSSNTPANQRLRQQVQVVFQDPFSSLSPRLTVEEIVGEGLLVHAPDLSSTQQRARVQQVLQEVGLDEEQFPGLLARYPHEFSGGQRQRLAIARALVVQPRMLVLDEPTSALDVTIQQQVLSLLQGLQRDKGLSYLLITHDMDVIRAMAHHILVMKDGQVLESGPMAQVLQQPQHAYTQQLMAAAALIPQAAFSS
ncbi:MAG: dipeptide ABC transporter ATP-binding protein [Giesbergeria sp.]|uniref:ABC transporter ATP-binding protein n=1 Tax=Giesbergeria sp. TaxID=2818473 RepID=UPI0026089D21|nr:dipeptide ABC transporter ATP-binding protein [Giesbergeria sp.]MDD2608363.1 dipeptide ABC transporter ATP-binding protein [Giesbergeria sp.]